MRHVELTVKSDTPARLDAQIPVLLPEITRAYAIKLIDAGHVTVNKRSVKKSDKVSSGDIITIAIPDPEPQEAVAQEIPIDIVYEDEDLLVVNKPKGMVVHPAPGNSDGTLVNALLAHAGDSLSGIGGVKRPGIVHRIDKDTSGLLIVAKNDLSHLRLAEQIKEHSFTREYMAVVLGNIRNESGVIDAPIGRHPVKRKQMAVTSKNSKNAVTHYSVVDRLNGYTVIALRLETGRTHQIRVHMAHIGHPVAGDPLYGGLNKSTACLQGQCLHAKKIGFVHPRTGEYMFFDSELPEYFKDFVRKNGL